MSQPGITREQVAHLADLARIELSDDELDRLGPEIAVIIESVAKVQEADIANVEPMSHPLPISNVFRDDVVTPSLTPEDALAGAPDADQQRFAVPKILGEE